MKTLRELPMNTMLYIRFKNEDILVIDKEEFMQEYSEEEAYAAVEEVSLAVKESITFSLSNAIDYVCEEGYIDMAERVYDDIGDGTIELIEKIVNSAIERNASYTDGEMVDITEY